MAGAAGRRAPARSALGRARRRDRHARRKREAELRTAAVAHAARRRDGDPAARARDPSRVCDLRRAVARRRRGQGTDGGCCEARCDGKPRCTNGSRFRSSRERGSARHRRDAARLTVEVADGSPVLSTDMEIPPCRTSTARAAGCRSSNTVGGRRCITAHGASAPRVSASRSSRRRCRCMCSTARSPSLHDRRRAAALIDPPP
jgi:hypothetical protein